jgi:hypothetical protein
MNNLLLPVAMVVAAAGAVGAGARMEQAQTVDVATVGPQVGQRVPGFRLPDQRGRQQTLSSVAGPKGTMVVFFRSADW